MKVRSPAVAGYFYPSKPDELFKMVDKFLKRKKEFHEDALGILSPHAGYIYSGYVAGSVMGSIPEADTFIILGPNHTGMGEPVSVFPEGVFKMPGFDMKVDENLSKKIVEKWKDAKFDTRAHLEEHSIEVQLPFLYRKNPDAKIVSICLGIHDLFRAKQGGQIIAEVIKNYDKKIILVASSDMTHYEPDHVAREKDRIAIERMKNLDEENLFKDAEFHNISMCGIIPAIVLISAVKHLGAKEGVLVDYMTSGDTGGGRASVVGYAGMVFY